MVKTVLVSKLVQEELNIGMCCYWKIIWDADFLITAHPKHLIS